MAERRDAVLREACDHLSNNLKFTLQLKPEQRNAVDYLLKKDDVLAVLPTGYGKSLIFQLFTVAVSIEGEERQTVLVICPLKIIIEDQIAEAGSLGIPAASTEDISEDELRAAKFRLRAAKFRSEAKLGANVAFRDAFGKLSQIRSFWTPILAITGTADGNTQSVIIKQLLLKKPP
ncbi:putative ATP-dependent DNA helicase Q1 [Stylophora pistillata]|uniref:putative ATP-dependent DNA helicase Q1 n=1 Tax=Stylophora pistillata TaxID=50429 RepID=UPI000C04B467|nr:putative ATP-dependent DNA helicase Q1 [Stylophora pistillata]